jgi:hypothetical protein
MVAGGWLERVLDVPRDRQEIYAMPATGGEAVAVTHSSRDNGLQQPAWRPS